jgi:hypothetical protein
MEMCWGDAGLLYWWIPANDLRLGDMSGACFDVQLAGGVRKAPLVLL